MYYKYSDYLKNRYGTKVYKLPVNLPITCPNREHGTGCTFCADVGTGFEAQEAEMTVVNQLLTNKEHIAKRYHAEKYIAYFQNYTNTYMPLKQFKQYMSAAAKFPDVVELSISTRPDCIEESYLQYLKEISEAHQISITIELGLQTVNYHTLQKINRGHTLAEYLDAVLRIAKYGFCVCTHIILNLPQDTMEDVIETAKVLSVLPVQIVKLHSLYIAKNSEMAKEYMAGEITICSKEEYITRLRMFLEYVRPDMVIERLFSRIPEEDSVFSNWGTSWWKLRDEFEEEMQRNESYQGKQFRYINGSALKRGGYLHES
ncbi:TIGR01212 family radical SAM protein [Anaerosporobacter faecicola]|uniref:TIGR01212 family radical SAM protein n=1 Tax=Anaerosporobacter faecicola TaxID=2718714 RepID=UPI00143CAC40|nr:TIGR01212 family radical SAM protein [Anaerosporobacter faecicola]